MEIGEAIKALKAGKRVARPAWASNKAALELFEESDGVHMIGWSSEHHPRQVWHPSVPDLLAEDWEIAA